MGNTGTYQVTWYSVPGLADGVYDVKRYDVRKTVSFPQSFSETPYAWGRGVATNGYSAANPNFGMGWCKVVPGSVTPTQVTLKTYVYKVWNQLGHYLGWYPTSPSNVTFAYTALEPLTLNITFENSFVEVDTPGVIKVEGDPYPAPKTWPVTLSDSVAVTRPPFLYQI